MTVAEDEIHPRFHAHQYLAKHREMVHVLGVNCGVADASGRNVERTEVVLEFKFHNDPPLTLDLFRGDEGAVAWSCPCGMYAPAFATLALKKRPGTDGRITSGSAPSMIRWALFCRKAAANTGFSWCRKIPDAH